MHPLSTIISSNVSWFHLNELPLWYLPGTNELTQYFPSVMRTVGDFVQVGLVATQDDQLVASLSRSDMDKVLADLGVQKVVSYSQTEPDVDTVTPAGSASREDPVSEILRPTKVRKWQRNMVGQVFFSCVRELDGQ